MKLADVSIKRPVFTTMIVAAILVLGLFSFIKLNVDQYPDVDIPYVVVTTVLPGAGPAQVETDVTKIVEDAVNPVEGVDHISSTSQEGVSIVVIQFKIEIDGKTAAQEVREKVAAVRSQLPDDIDDPVIQRFDPANFPILTLTVAGDRSDRDITEYTKNIIKKRLENIPGVGSVELVGGAEREILIEVDAERLKAYNLSIQDIIMKVGGANVEIPGGNLNQGDRQLILRTMGKITDVRDFGNIVVANPRGQIVYLSDIATVLDTTEERESLTRLNGKNAVGLDIKKQSGSNTVQVAAGIKKELKKLQAEVPPDIKITLARDNSEFIQHSVNDVLFDLIYGSILAVLVIYLFLANGRATFISALALPTSIIGSFILMSALGFTLNVMSLLALSLAVGLLIDDAIVVIENIYRHMSEGETAWEAAKSASEEIGLAVMAVTLSLVAVFVPVAFMPGIVGRFFFQFGMTVTFAVLVSLFVAFSLTPMLSSRWLKAADEELTKEGNLLKKILYYFNHFFDWLSRKYVRALGWSVKHRLITVLSALAIFFMSFYLMKFIGSEFFPQQDQGEFTIVINAAPGYSLEQTDKICKKIENEVGKNHDIKTLLTTIGAGNNTVNQAQILVKLISKQERNYNVYDYMNTLRKNINIPGAKVSFLPPGGPGGQQKPVMFSVRGENLGKLEQIADKVEGIVKTTYGAVDVENSLETSKPEVKIRLEREKAAELGINPANIATTVRAMVDGFDATKYQEGDDQYNVRIRLQPEDRTTIQDVSNITVKSDKKTAAGGNILIPLSDVAFIDNGVGPSKINRYDRQREIRIDANVYDRFFGEVLGDAQSRISTLSLPEGYSVKIAGSGEMQAESFFNIFISLILAIVFVYIVLAAQFESFIYPFSIMLALPMAIIGAVIALIIFKSSMSVMSLIGIIMLMGLVSKNGILLVDYINIQRGRGHERFDAILIAGPTRLRPILMTTFAMIFGMIPVAFSFGEGSEFRSPMGQAVIGGLITSTLLTLFIVPVVYTILDDISIKKAIKWAANLFNKKKSIPGIQTAGSEK
ncbi:MAG TPA: efflux RND transporter permease subunit [Ignavibacteriaceae bacterium]|nr:efflux RND transporter permease subunit [Ignavibacteriaceae bacterium]